MAKSFQHMIVLDCDEVQNDDWWLLCSPALLRWVKDVDLEGRYWQNDETLPM
jgi:hypothetical protein